MQKDIIVRLKGGLGNQLFQYAFGRAYAKKHNRELKLDITDYPRQTLRNYGLNSFNISQSIAPDEDVRKAKYPYGIFSKFIRLINQKILRQYNIGFEPKIIENKKLLYIDGFFQSEKYFESIAPIIRKEFTLKKPLSLGAEEAKSKISLTPNPISLHVRRGDFVSSTRNSIFHVACSPLYYSKAMDIMLVKYPNATFFAFSDDIEWVKQNIASDKNIIYVSEPGIKDFEEIILMSHCHNHIIANSSFSWWGAWLNPRNAKTVICPTIWRANDFANLKNMIPDSWIQIPNQPE